MSTTVLSKKKHTDPETLPDPVPVTHRPGAAAAERFLGPQRGGGRPGRPLLHRDGAASVPLENP